MNNDKIFSVENYDDSDLDLDLIDPFYSQNDNPDNDASNPFYLDITGSKFKFTKVKDLTQEYSSVYILCLADDFENTVKNMNRIKVFFEKDSDESELKSQAKLIALVKCPKEILYLFNIRQGLVQVNKNMLEYFNQESYNFNEKELVFLMLETKEKNVRMWLKSHEKSKHFDKFVKKKLFASFYKLDDRKFDKCLLNDLNNDPEFMYWQISSNCKISSNDNFLNRKFNIPGSDKWNLPKSKMEKHLHKILINFKESKSKLSSGYPTEITRTDKNIFCKDKDLNTTKTSNDIDSNSKYFIAKEDDLNIDKELVTELLTKNALTEKEKYYLICNLMSSKKYCHYIINNKDILVANSDIIEKYGPVFKYLMGYSWICMYLEECIKKTKTQQDSRYVFDLETACLLPVYPFDQSSPYNNPYFTCLVSDFLINTTSNLHSVRQSLEYQQGLVNPEEFKKRLNLFISGDENKDLLQDINWNNMVITGGIMSAIIPKNNPLFSLYKKSSDIKYSELSRFFDEYYADSDIDIACNHSNILDFVEHVKNIKICLAKNLNKPLTDENILCTPIKSLAVYVNSKILKEKCDSGEIPHSYDYIISNKYERAVKFYFYELYLEKKNQANVNNKKILGEKINDNEYFNIIDYCDFDKLNIIINDYKLQSNNFDNKNPDVNSGLELTYIVNQDKTNPDSEIFIKYSETIKYKISSKHFKHQFEIFRIGVEEFFGCVSRFHLPAVRSYYNGDKCYLLPSAITAYHTLTNIDFKYFVGTSDPINIIDKYRKRGYGTILNKSEIKNYLSYIASFDKRIKSYQINITEDDVSSLKTIIGPLDINHAFFKPRKFIAEDFLMSNIKPEYNTPKLNYIDSNIINDYYKKKYPNSVNVFTYKNINSRGYVEPLKKWIIDAVYDTLN
ncbi:hypothetical protein ma490 [Moumouvirus australiensis]|uniref:Uncharacterized protein n=1 Tax=Moumouvirus australiensis TaxID=2109587 RepID=A0A2P1ELV5_9VIRU|nr:hypothetical protein QKC55_gp415 [Moumouvirus australiensis]AVL94876.1 hypothetical protein ma490 [Moumouvirus australiensis]